MNLLRCSSCNSSNVQIITGAFHASIGDIEYFEDEFTEETVYVAYNSDSSWRTINNTEEFVCQDCWNHWPIDKDVRWEWLE